MPEPSTSQLAARPLRREPRRRSRAGRRSLRLVSFLAPNMLPVYQFLARRLEARVGLPIEVVVGEHYADIGDADLAFICSLAYVNLVDQGLAAIEPLAAPVLLGERYRNEPIYFSDVIVRDDSPFNSFAELRGASWAYNEPQSQSGYGITRHHLLQLGEVHGFFGRVAEAGWHEVAVRLVADGAVTASAIDSQVLAVVFREHPELAARLRIIASLGPSSIQPLVVARQLPAALKANLLGALLDLEHDASAQAMLAHGFIRRFAAVNERTYDDIRAMQQAARRANFLRLH